MKVYIFSDNSTLEKNFYSCGKSPFQVSFHKYSTLRSILKDNKEAVVVYLDVKGRENGFKKDFNYLAKQKMVYPAILDPGGAVEDTGSLFLSGAVDYLCGSHIQKLFTEKRLDAVLAYMEQFRNDYKKPTIRQKKQNQAEDKYRIACNWNDIIEGKEYTFALLYIEFDDKEDLVKKHNKIGLSQALVIFKNFIERHVLPYNGRIWMWHDFGGIVLFPFTGNNCPCVISAFKIMMYKLLYDVEESSFPHFISFRIAIHIGNLVYHKQETGNIISDTINSVFHLGKIYTEPGNMTVTEEIMDKTPEQLKKYFKLMGKYEDRLIYKLRRPRFLVSE